MNLHPFVPVRCEVFLLQHITTAREAVFGNNILGESGKGVYKVDFLSSFNAGCYVSNHLIHQTFQDRLKSPNISWREEFAERCPTHLVKVMPNCAERHLITPEHAR